MAMPKPVTATPMFVVPEEGAAREHRVRTRWRRGRRLGCSTTGLHSHTALSSHDGGRQTGTPAVWRHVVTDG
eukprot:scaffold82192_cov63-Phaeocystis_antarctica.AAC.2